MRAFICGCAATILTGDEIAFLKEADPFGLILFKRNIDGPAQVLALTETFRSIVGRGDAPVLIDQEGGRVQRLRPPHWRNYPAAAHFGRLDPEEGAALAHLAGRLLAADLKAVGINVDCAPVLDVPVAGSHDVIGDRAYGQDPSSVARLGRAKADGLLAGGVLPVMKHLPGHGRALADSHHDLPVVTAPREELEAADFAPFRANADLPAAMTAHVVYTAIDADRPATTSPIVIRDIIRGAIGFDGLLMSDDLSMKALGGSFTAKTEALFAAGVDLALHCNGDLTEASAVAAASPALVGRAAARAAAALAALSAEPEPFDPVDAWQRIAAGLAMEA